MAQKVDSLASFYGGARTKASDNIRKDIFADPNERTKLLIELNTGLGLEKDEKDWTLNPIVNMNQKLPEVRKVKLVLVANNSGNGILEHYSEGNRMLRGVAWLTIYLKYLRKKINGPQS